MEEQKPTPRIETTSIAETLSSTSQDLAIEPEPPREEEIHPLEFPLDVKADLFFDFGNALNQPVQKKSSARKAPNHHFSNLIEETYHQETVQELASIMSNE